MKRSNNQTNSLIKWAVVAGDFILLNVVLWLGSVTAMWGDGLSTSGLLASNVALLLAELVFPPIVQMRVASAGNILKRVLQLTASQTVLAYLVSVVSGRQLPATGDVLATGIVLFMTLLLARFFERLLVKWLRSVGRNTRMVTFVGSDMELAGIYDRLISDTTTGYHLLGYYADAPIVEALADKDIQRLGSIDQLLVGLKDDTAVIGDELYLCVPRRESRLIRRLSKYCEQRMKRFYFVPVAEELQGVSLQPERIEDLEIYTTVKSPLLSPVNKAVKRLFDLLFSVMALSFILLLYPIIGLIIKWQSPGPVFFRQERTGLDGQTFSMLKFRSMHVNAEADSLQATKDDPRKFPFGDWMRRTNIDELPQFWNVFKGEMSVVGPRPHMLAHTEMYAQLIDKYMVRHFIKPGITGWAQVTGYRGETRELWQMEGRVKRDIWYMEHWTIWLDIRIVWKTIKAMFLSNNKNAC